MSYKFTISIMLIAALAATLCIVAIKPQMHKPFFIYNSDYVIVQNDAHKEVEEKEIPTVKQDVDITKIVKTVAPQKTEQTQQVQNLQKVEQIKQNQQIPKIQQQVQQTQQVQRVAQELQAKKLMDIKKQIDLQQKTITQKKQTIPNNQYRQPISTPVSKTQTQSKDDVIAEVSFAPNGTVTLTQNQEEIAWNRWRSNLQNKIMQDVNLPPVETGTIFRFRFDVDKYGRISNVKTWSTNPAYTPYAVQFIAPVIRSYQGKSILNFPVGSARTTTTFTGGWKIAEITRYSSPRDYNDTETVIK